MCTCRSISLIIEKNLWSCGRGQRVSTWTVLPFAARETPGLDGHTYQRVLHQIIITSGRRGPIRHLSKSERKKATLT